MKQLLSFSLEQLVKHVDFFFFKRSTDFCVFSFFNKPSTLLRLSTDISFRDRFVHIDAFD